MAEAIPKVEWSEAEEYAVRLFYWEYLVDRWLAPGLSVLKEPGSEAALVTSSSVGHITRERGWLMEPETIVEQ
jgi:hypothetical protein